MQIFHAYIANNDIESSLEEQIIVIPTQYALCCNELLYHTTISAIIPIWYQNFFYLQG